MSEHTWLAVGLHTKGKDFTRSLGPILGGGSLLELIPADLLVSVLVALLQDFLHHTSSLVIDTTTPETIILFSFLLLSFLYKKKLILYHL